MRKLLVTVILLLTAALTWGQSTERYLVLDGIAGVVRVHNVSDNTEVAAIRAGSLPNSVVISPNGRLAFVAALANQYVSVLDLTINAEVRRIRDFGPEQLAMSADGTRIVATHINDEGITILDATTLSIIRSLDLNGRAGDDPNQEDLGFNNPVILGNKAYLNTSNDIIMVDLSSFAVTLLSGPDDALFFQGAENLALTPDGKTLAAIRANGLVLMNTSTNTPILTVPFGFAFSVVTGHNPFDPAKMVAYVGNSGSAGPVLSVVDISPGSATFGTILGEVPLPPTVPASSRTMLALNPSGSRVYVNVGVSFVNSNPNVFVVDTGAIITNPASAVIHQAQISFQPRSIAVAAVLNQPPPTAPVVTAVNRKEIKNDHDENLEISGSGFIPGASVHVGGVDPIVAEFVSSRRLRVTIPENSPSQIASIVVTNPNTGQPVAVQQQSGILRDALTISANFKPDNEVGVANFGDHSFSIIGKNNADGLTTEIPTGPRPSGLAMSPDGTRAYIANLFSPASVEVFNFSTRSIEAHIVLNGSHSSLPGQSKGVALAPRLATGRLAAFVVASRPGNLDLYTIDADPASSTFNTVVDDIPTGITTASSAPDAVIMTPDGRFAFIDELESNGEDANLVVIDMATRAVTLLPSAALGMLPFQLTMDISADGKYLVLVSQGDNFLIFDITHPASPALVATLIGASTPEHPKVILEFPRIVGDRLFAFDIDHNIVSIFNFKPATGNFSELADFTIPGPTAIITAVGDVTPDGKLVYFAVREEDAVAVLDVEKIIRHDPAALITKIGVGLTPEYVAVRP